LNSKSIDADSRFVNPSQKTDVDYIPSEIYILNYKPKAPVTVKKLQSVVARSRS